MEHLKITLTYTIKYIFIFSIGFVILGLPIDIYNYFACDDCELGWQNFELTITLIRVGFYGALWFGIIAGIMNFAMMPRDKGDNK